VPPAPAASTRPTEARPPAQPASAPTPKGAPRAAAKPSPVEPRRTANAAPPAPLSRLTIQVGAFKERSAAEAIIKRLKGKGYSAYLVPVSEGLFNVRVGSFTEREDAERIMAKLETQEKFKPFIVKP
jgi:cell division septation protein DedD